MLTCKEVALSAAIATHYDINARREGIHDDCISVGLHNSCISDMYAFWRDACKLALKPQMVNFCADMRVSYMAPVAADRTRLP